MERLSVALALNPKANIMAFHLIVQHGQMPDVGLTYTHGVPDTASMGLSMYLGKALQLLRLTFHETNYAQLAVITTLQNVDVAYASQSDQQSQPLPREVVALIPSMYARNFLYSIDTIGCLLRVLVDDPRISTYKEDLEKINEQLEKDFENYREMRNTAHHIEDRFRALQGQWKKTSIQVQPSQIGAMHSTGITLGHFNGTTYSTLLNDGSHGHIDLTVDSVTKLQAIVQRIFDVFPWYGVGFTYPQ